MNLKQAMHSHMIFFWHQMLGRPFGVGKKKSRGLLFPGICSQPGDCLLCLARLFGGCVRVPYTTSWQKKERLPGTYWKGESGIWELKSSDQELQGIWDFLTNGKVTNGFFSAFFWWANWPNVTWTAGKRHMFSKRRQYPILRTGANESRLSNLTEC